MLPHTARANKELLVPTAHLLLWRYWRGGTRCSHALVVVSDAAAAGLAIADTVE